MAPIQYRTIVASTVDAKFDPAPQMLDDILTRECVDSWVLHSITPDFTSIFGARWLIVLAKKH